MQEADCHFVPAQNTQLNTAQGLSTSTVGFSVTLEEIYFVVCLTLIKLLIRNL